MAQIIISSLPPSPSETGTATPLGTDITPATNILDFTASTTGTTYKYARWAELNFYLTAQGLTTYNAVTAATTDPLTATYSNGVDGVGATLTNAGAQAVFSLDGVTLPLAALVLIKNQAASAQNGIYVVTNTGSTSTNWILTRSADFNSDTSIIQYGVVLVNQGTVNAGLLWQETGAGPFTLGTTAITFALYSVFTPFVTNLTLGTIYDTNGNIILSFSPNTSAVNYLNIVNNVTTANPQLRALGTDTNISISLVPKGTGAVVINSANLTTPLLILSGTASQHSTTFNFANTSASRTLTFPDASGTILVSGQNAYIPQIIDSSSNPILAFSSSASAVNYLSASNSATGSAVAINPVGADANIQLNIFSKVAGAIVFGTTATTAQYIYFSGAGYEHESIFNFPSASSVSSYTWPDAVGTVQISGQAISAPSINFGGTTLANYVEGTWTPVLVGSGGGSATYSSQVGTYTRIGNRILFDLAISIAGSTLTGNISISGLPVSIGSSAGSATFYLTSAAASATPSVMAITGASSSVIFLYTFVSGTATLLTTANLGTSANIIISGQYHA